MSATPHSVGVQGDDSGRNDADDILKSLDEIGLTDLSAQLEATIGEDDATRTSNASTAGGDDMEDGIKEANDRELNDIWVRLKPGILVRRIRDDSPSRSGLARSGLVRGALAVMGRDSVGLLRWVVEELLMSAEANIYSTVSTRMGDLAVLVLLFHAPATKLQQLIKRAKAMQLDEMPGGLLHRPPGPQKAYQLDLHIRKDKPRILLWLTKLVAAKGLNIRNLTGSVSSAEKGGEPEANRTGTMRQTAIANRTATVRLTVEVGLEETAQWDDTVEAIKARADVEGWIVAGPEQVL